MPALGPAVRDALAPGGEGLAIAFGGCEYDRDWLWRTAAAIEAGVSAVAADAPVALVARNRPGHVATLAAQVAAQRTTIMIHAAQAPTGIARDIAAVRAPVIVAAAGDWTREAVAAAAASGAVGLVLPDDPLMPVDAHAELATAGAGPFRAPSPAVAFELLTSGTTGAPKRMPLRWDTVAKATADARTVYEHAGGVVAPQVMIHPLGNVAGVSFLLPPLATGQPICLLERFEVEAWVEAVERYRPVRCSLPAAAVRMILAAEVAPSRLASLQVVGVGGGRIEPDQRDAFEARYGIPVLLAYGATEFGGVVANWTLDLYRRFGRDKRGSVGRPSPGVALRVIDADSGIEVPAGTIGLLEVRADRLGPDWLRTSDLAHLDADGFLYLDGRADDAVNRGGFTVVPDRVASALRAHPAVADAAVVGLAEPRLGEVPVAALELNADSQIPSERDLAAFLRDRLLAYEVPTRFRIVERLPRNGAMKIARAEVRAMFETQDLGSGPCI